VRVAVIAVLACALRVAHADPVKPWAVGVDADKQRQALALYDKGNGEFTEDHYKEALAQYEQALAVWDHPAIRYNAAVCLINLDRPVEAYENFAGAIHYGADPIGAEHFAQAKTYMKALAGQVAEVEVTSKEPGAEVRLDGQPLLSDAGTATRRVRAGEHQIVASKPRYETKSEKVDLEPISRTAGKPNVIVIELHLLPSTRRLVRRWPVWQPWTIAAGGAALAGAGAGLTWLALSNRDGYQAWLDKCKLTAPYCAGQSASSSAYDHAKIEYPIGLGALSLGGAALVAGAVMIYLNQGHMVSVEPSVGTEHASLTLVGRW
jgi:hypothetical protein